MSERDMALLLDMLMAARDAQTFIEGMRQEDFLSSRLHQNAVIRSLEIIGEAAGKISVEGRQRMPEFRWRDMTGLRHRLIHGYGDVRMDLVWDVARNQLPSLILTLDQTLQHNKAAGT
jgi:uncharacterized protein with HEPN domain